MEATPELMRIVTEAIGDIRTNNIAIVGYSNTLRGELSAGLIEKIAKTAIEAIPTR